MRTNTCTDIRANDEPVHTLFLKVRVVQRKRKQYKCSSVKHVSTRQASARVSLLDAALLHSDAGTLSATPKMAWRMSEDARFQTKVRMYISSRMAKHVKAEAGTAGRELGDKNLCSATMTHRGTTNNQI